MPLTKSRTHTRTRSLERPLDVQITYFFVLTFGQPFTISGRLAAVRPLVEASWLERGPGVRVSLFTAAREKPIYPSMKIYTAAISK